MIRESESISAAIPCHVCGYDVCVQLPDGLCPECGASVVDSVRLAAIPRRPAWRDSDPRWRRRMLAGAWVLVFVPLMTALDTFGWAARIHVPTFFDVQGAQSLDQSYIIVFQSYACFTFCIGGVLLFAKERNRQRNRLDWTRRWGIITSYLVFLLGVPIFGFVTDLVAMGIAALFMSMRFVDQPALTGVLAHLSSGYIYYAPFPGPLLSLSVVGFSSSAVLLACAPLYNALRSSGPKLVAAVLLAVLALGSVVQLWHVIEYIANPAAPSSSRFGYFYFSPDILMSGFTYHGSNPFLRARAASVLSGEFVMEAAKWFAILTIAAWLTIAQIASKGRPRPSS